VGDFDMDFRRLGIQKGNAASVHPQMLGEQIQHLVNGLSEIEGRMNGRGDLIETSDLVQF